VSRKMVFSEDEEEEEEEEKVNGHQTPMAYLIISNCLKESWKYT